MPKIYKDAIVNYSDLIEGARETAVALMDGNAPDAVNLFYENNLENLESGIKKLNEYSSKCWLISAITLYSVVYDKMLYQQSGLTWEEYLRDSRKRLGLDPRDVSEQLSSARFFIKNHKALQKAHWNPIGSGRKLARAELAVELSGSLSETIEHIAKDTWTEFNSWYSSFKEVHVLPASTDVQPDTKNKITIKKNVIKVNGIEPVTINPELDDADKEKIQGYLVKIFESLKSGYEPAIIPVYDNKEANRLLNLRDKERQKK